MPLTKKAKTHYAGFCEPLRSPNSGPCRADSIELPAARPPSRGDRKACPLKHAHTEPMHSQAILVVGEDHEERSIVERPTASIFEVKNDHVEPGQRLT